MNHSEIFRGTIRAHGFIFDLAVLGDTDAQQRIMGLLTPTSMLHMIDATRCVIVFETPQMVRVQQAPGMPLVRVAGQLVNASDPPPHIAGNLIVLHNGQWEGHQTSRLLTVDPSSWLDLRALTVTTMTPLQVAPSAPTAVIDRTAAPVSNLRSSANIAPRSAKMEKRRKSLLQGAAKLPGSKIGGTGGGTDSPKGSPAAPKTQPVRSFLAKLYLQSPAARSLHRKHAKYLDELRQQLERGDWEEALRNAISVAESTSLGASIGVPSRRNSLAPSTEQRQGSRTVGYGPTVHFDLKERYRKAATDLEKVGKIEQAAFVYVDLLGVPLEAIALLERHQRWPLAAEIAEGHLLDVALRVELWWKAGRQDLSVSIARRHGAFADAIARSAKTDQHLANQLRAEWVSLLLRAGATLSATEVAWPNPELRSTVEEAIDHAITADASDASTLRAYRLALRPTPENRSEMLQQLAVDTPLDAHELRQLIVGLGRIRGEDLAADAEAATAATRALLPLASMQSGDAELGAALKSFSTRIDPILVADLPSISSNKGATHGRIQVVEATMRSPGLRMVHDAVVLPNAMTIVALGEGGVRLLSASGGIAAKWQIPTHSVVVADHGSHALLLTQRGEIVDVHQLNLVTRQVKRWATLRLLKWADSYDGAAWIVVDANGISALDTLADEPVALWRELSAADVVMSLQRSATHLSAGIHHEVPGPEIWEWELPSFTLRNRRPWVGHLQHVLASGDPIVVSVFPDGLELKGRGGDASVAGRTLDVMASGTHFAVHVNEGPDDAATVSVFAGSPQTPSARIQTLSRPVRLRHVGSTVTLHDATGQIFAFDHTRPGWTRSHRLTT
jgi:MoxR-vWA-beta-propeller ternary system domain bpX6